MVSLCYAFTLPRLCLACFFLPIKWTHLRYAQPFYLFPISYSSDFVLAYSLDPRGKPLVVRKLTPHPTFRKWKIFYSLGLLSDILLRPRRDRVSEPCFSQLFITLALLSGFWNWGFDLVLISCWEHFLFSSTWIFTFNIREGMCSTPVSHQ